MSTLFSVAIFEEPIGYKTYAEMALLSIMERVKAGKFEVALQGMI